MVETGAALVARGLAKRYGRLPQVIKWAPFAATSAMLGGGSAGICRSGCGSVPDPARPRPRRRGGFAVWLILAAGFAALWTERAEISG